MTAGYNRLARLLKERSEVRNPDQHELGLIEPGLNLKLDHFDVSLPPEAYLSCVQMLEPGQRVLVAWVNNGKLPVIVNVVVN